MYKVDAQMSTAELGLLKAKKIAEVEAFIKSDIEYNEGYLVSLRHLYLAYRIYCRRNNLYTLRKGELWRTLYDLGFTTVMVDNKPFWYGLLPKYVQVTPYGKKV